MHVALISAYGSGLPAESSSRPGELTGRRIRRLVLTQSTRAFVDHLGSALSMAHILATLYGQVLNISTPEDSERDRLILSNGHAALALYAALALRGWLPVSALQTYCDDDSLLGMNPQRA